MINSVCYNNSINTLIEKALKGDKNSSLALARSLCLDTDVHDGSNLLNIKLLDPQSTDNPHYTKLCKALLEARSPGSYKMAKETFKVYAHESNQEGFVAKMMLIYIKAFSPKKTWSITKKFQEAISNAKINGDCFSEIQIKEDFLEFILNYSTDPEEIESGLQLQLSLIDDLSAMDLSKAFDVEDLTDRQLNRYLDLIIKYFGGVENERKPELEAKETLVRAKDNLLLNSHLRNLAEYHLANLLLINEFPEICDIRESMYLFKKLLNQLDKENHYYFQIKFKVVLMNKYSEGHFNCNLLNTVRIPLASMVNNKNASDLRAKSYYNLAISYLQRAKYDYKEFDFQKAYEYFTNVLTYADPSSFLIPLARFQLGCILLFKEGKGLTEASLHFNELIKYNNFNPEFDKKIKFIYSIISNVNVYETKIRDIENKQLLFYGFLSVASENSHEISLLFDTHQDDLKQLKFDTDRTSDDIRTIVKQRLIDFLNSNSVSNYNQLIHEISWYLAQKNNEFILRSTERADRFEIAPKKISYNKLQDSEKTGYELNTNGLARDLLEILLSLEGDCKSEVCFCLFKYFELYF